MEERIKLPRITNFHLYTGLWNTGFHYTTGDAQDWTYEYTWEDFELAIRDDLITSSAEVTRLHRKIEKYFLENSEKLFDCGVYNGKGYSTESVQIKLKGMKDWELGIP